MRSSPIIIQTHSHNHYNYHSNPLTLSLQLSPKLINIIIIITIPSFLSSLLVQNLWWPAFSSSLVIELHSALSKQFYIRVLYDDVDVTRKLSFCKSRFTNVDGLCLFDNFTFFVLREMQSSFGYETYSEFCEH